MELYEALLSRRTVFKYEDTPVPDDVLDRALEAARWAPNHKLTEPWRFLVVGPETRLKLGPVAERLAYQKANKQGREATPELIDKQIKKITELPALVVVLNRKSPDDAFLEREDYAASCCALHNLVLSLHADGFGSQWGTGGLTRDAETYRLLDVDPEQWDIIGFVKIGRPQTVPATRRRPLDEVVSRLP
jgi:nitroreductase